MTKAGTLLQSLHKVPSHSGIVEKYSLNKLGVCCKKKLPGNFFSNNGFYYPRRANAVQH